MKVLFLTFLCIFLHSSFLVLAQNDDDDDDDETRKRRIKNAIPLKKYYPNQFSLKSNRSLLMGAKLGWAWQPAARGNANTFLNEVSFLVGSIKKSSPEAWSLGYHAFSIGFESDFNNLQAPKIGFEANFIGLGFRTAVAGYAKNERWDIRGTIELGISILGYFNIKAGWSIPFIATQGTFDELGRFRVTLSSNIVFW